AAGRPLRHAGGELPRVARLPHARSRRRPVGGVPRARPRGPQPRPALRRARPRLRPAQLRHLGCTRDRGGRADGGRARLSRRGAGHSGEFSSRAMRGVVIAITVLVLAPAAHAGCPVPVSRDHGAAPLRVVFRAGCASKVYRWRFGDGTAATGRTVTHTFRAGRFTPVLRTKGGGVRRLGPVTSIALRLVAP